MTSLSAPAYFERVGDFRYRAHRTVEGAWNTEEQHIAPALGLLTHLIERDHLTRRDGAALQISRASFDILGTLPIDEVDVGVHVLRAGRTIELVEGVLSHGGRAALIARIWFLQPSETAGFEGSALTPFPHPSELDEQPMPEYWPGEFVRTVKLRGRQLDTGHAQVWLEPQIPLLVDEEIGATARLFSVVDIANGLTPRTTPNNLAFPNVDLTAHLLRSPVGPGIGFDTTASYGPSGVGMTHTVLHDERGVLGTATQSLTLRPRS